MADFGTFGWKGLKNRAFEFPAGVKPGFAVDVSPTGRMRFRYNDVDKRPEVSIDGAAYVPLATGVAASPQYGEIYVVENVAALAVNTVTYTLVDAFDTVGPTLGVNASLGPNFSLQPNPGGGVYFVSVNVTILGDVGIGYLLAVFNDGIITHIRGASGNDDGASARVISCSGLLSGVVEPLDVRILSQGGDGDVTVFDAQFSILKASA